jgi:hypothetical protein
MRSADARSAKGPTRTRYRRAGPDPPGKTYTAKPCPFSFRDKLSAFARLAKLPNWTAHAARWDVGEGTAVSTAAGGCGAALDVAALEVVGFDIEAPAAFDVAVAGAGATAADVAAEAAADAAVEPSVPSVSPSEFAGALLVAKSSVTFRVGSAAI